MAVSLRPVSLLRLLPCNLCTLLGEARTLRLETEEAASHRPGATLLSLLFLLIPVAFNLHQLWPQVATQAPRLNDEVMHLLVLSRAEEAISLGQDPTDFWLAPIGMGYPLFHHYQHLPYLPLAVAHRLLPQGPDLERLFGWTTYLLLSLFPLSIYFSMRKLNFDRMTAAAASLVAPLIATDNLYGLEFGSYVWRGYGLYTQLWGMVLLPPAIAQGCAALRGRAGFLAATFLLAITTLCHPIFGYVALITLFVLVLMPCTARRGRALLSAHTLRDVGIRAKRYGVLCFLVLLVISYFVVPLFLDRVYANRSVLEPSVKYDSYGLVWVLQSLATGALFDFGRFPSLTVLVGAGFAFSVFRWREEQGRFLVVLCAVWLALYAGRPTWGRLMDLLPLGSELHLHRFVAGVHLVGIYLIGVGLALLWRWPLSVGRPRFVFVSAAMTCLLLLPAFRERVGFLRENSRWIRESSAALAVEETDISNLIRALQNAPPGRVYAGLASNWGSEYTVGPVPVYDLLYSAGLDMLGFPFHALSINSDVQVLFDEQRPEQYNLFNVRYVVAPVERVVPGFLRPTAAFGRHRVYEADTTGYFDLVDCDATFTGQKGDVYTAASDWLASDLPEHKEHPAIVLGSGNGACGRSFPLLAAGSVFPRLASPSGSARGRILAERIEPNVYEAWLEASREAMVLVKVTYHPGLRAFVDNIEQEPVMLMPSYVGLRVGPGTHEVRLEYHPPDWRGPLILAGLTVLGALACTDLLARPGSDRPCRPRSSLSASSGGNGGTDQASESVWGSPR